MRDTNGWVGLGWVGVLRYYSLAQTLTKPEKPQNQEKKNRQQNNAVITVVTRTKIREKKKKGTGTGSDVSVPRVVKLLLLLGRPPTTTIYGR